MNENEKSKKAKTCKKKMHLHLSPPPAGKRGNNCWGIVSPSGARTVGEGDVLGSDGGLARELVAEDEVQPAAGPLCVVGKMNSIRNPTL